MRSKGLWVVVLLAIVGAAAWLALRPAADPTVAGGGDVDGPGSGAAAPGGVAPTSLAGAAPGAGAGPAQASPRGALRGRGVLVGTVRRNGAPTAARVEVRLAIGIDARQAMSRGPATFFARIVAPPLALEAPAAVVSAGADGRFVVEGLATGAWHVRAVASDGAVGSAHAQVAADGARASADVAIVAGTEVLVGRVVRADGAPFVGIVTVDPSSGGRGDFGALLSSGEPITLGADGGFRATGLEPGTYVVSAIEVGVSRAVGRAVVVPTTEPYVLTLPAATSVVEGRVTVEPDGEAVPNAVVLGGGSAQGALELVVARTTADAKGAFRLAITPGADRAVVATATGYAPAMLPLPAGLTGPVEVRMTRAGTVTGRVTSDGDGLPVRGLEVAALNMGRGLPFGAEPARTDADGRYTLTDVPPGDVMVYASGQGWVTKGAGEASRGFNPLSVALPPGGTATADLVVQRGGRLAGVVFGPDGAPVSGAVVRGEARANEAGFRGFGFGTEPATATGADGVFLLEGLLADSPYDLVVQAVGAAEARVGPSVPTTATTPPRVEVRLVAPRTVEVAVVEAEGQAPIVGARVTVYVVNAHGSTGRPAGVTDGRGVLRVDVAPGATATVNAHHDEYLGADAATVPADGDRVVVTLRRALAIEGVLLDADGSPVANVRVSAKSPGRWVRPVVTDGAGKFRLISLERGTYELEARLLKESRVGLVATARVAAGTTGVELRLARPEGQATGLVVRVVDADGKAVPRARVNVRFAESGSTGATVENGLAIVDATGREDGLVGATVTVSAPRSLGGQPLPFGPATVGPLLGSEAEVEVRLPAERAIVGVVRDPDGKPVRGAVVVAADPSEASNVAWVFRSDGGDLPRARTDADGRFRLGGLGDVEVSLFVQPPPEFPAPDPVSVRGGGPDVVITLTAGVAVAVTVLDDAGAPVPGASVSTHIVEARREDEPWRTPIDGPVARADAAGVARLRGLDARKRYHLGVNGPSDGWLQHTTAEWSPKDLTVRLARALKVAGVVRDPSGKPLAGVAVYRQTGENSWTGGPVTDASGRFELRDVAAGEVILRASVGPMGAGEPGPGVAEVRTRAGASDVVLTLDPGLELLLRLADPTAAEPYAMAQVVILDPEGRPRSTSHVRFEAEGVGRVRGLSAADRCVVWLAPDREGRSFLARDARPGTEVVVARKPGLAITGRLSVPAGATDVHVAAQLADLWIGVQGTRAADGAFEIRGLPEGTTWQLNANGQVEGRWVATQGPVVAAGGNASFDLKESR